MKNYELTYLLAPINEILKISKPLQKSLTEININNMIDLLLYLPYKVLKTTFFENIENQMLEQLCYIKGTVLSYNKQYKFTQIICSDKKGTIFYITLFKIYGNYLEKYLPLNQTILIKGIAKNYKGKINFTHPEVTTPSDTYQNDIEVCYKQYHNISSQKFAFYIQKSIKILKECGIPEWLEQNTLHKYSLPTFQQAIINLHTPQNNQDLEYLNNKNILRLALDELIAHNLQLNSMRDQNYVINLLLTEQNILGNELIKHLPFTLTKDQTDAINYIQNILKQKHTSAILLQGDVGSGKTIVCIILSMLLYQNNYQVAIMAPTSVLAEQHYKNFIKYSKNIPNINISLLKGNEKKATREAILQGLYANEIHIIIGTHALIQDDIRFHKLGLAIIDEQHKFGVEQRHKLIQKGLNVALILTTATPIPRTLALTLHGDIYYVSMKNKPENRQYINTYVISNNRLNEVVTSVSNAILAGKKIFWVCPLIEESEKLNHLQSINSRYKIMLDNVPNQDSIFLLNGKMNNQDKKSIIQNFTDYKKGALLISTTIIEVGVDIPSCNIIIIEDANQYGLSQLHQLRGRVGRGTEKAMCLLIYNHKLSKNGEKRLKVLKNSNDGFYIAQQDLNIRGWGEFAGTLQNGMEHFKIINLEYHSAYIDIANTLTKHIIKTSTTQIIKIIMNLYGKQYYKNYLKHS